MEQDKYPHWKDALADSSLIVNLRCAVKYLLWHSIYLVLTVIGALFIGAAMLVEKVGATKTAQSTGSFIESILTSSKLKRAVETIITIAAYVVVIGFSIGLAYTVWLNPMTGVFMLATFGGAVIVTILLLALDEWGLFDKLFGAGEKTGSVVKRGASKAGSKAAKTPVIRRVYGNCPVSMNQCPRWFDKIFDD